MNALVCRIVREVGIMIPLKQAQKGENQQHQMLLRNVL